MNFTLVLLLSYSIGAGAIISLFRLKKLEQAYFPFIIFLWLGFLNEITSTFTIEYFRSNAINCNIYVLLSSLAILWQFSRWRLFTREGLPFFICGLLLAVWIYDNFIFSTIIKFNPYFRILYSFIVVLMSIHMINRLIADHTRRLLRSSVFLICVCFIVFFTYKAMIEIFWLYGLGASKDFRVSVYRIMTYINLSVNILYAIAVLWIPTKREHTLL